MSNKHNKVIEVLYQLCKKYKKYKKVYADHIGKDYKPIVLHSSPKKGQKAETLNYNPDIWTEDNKGGIDVFEVWDTEKDSECIGDVVPFALIKNNQWLHIVCLNENRYDFAKKLDKIILDSLYNEDKEFLARNNSIITFAPNEYIKNENKLKKYLKKKLQF